jgi:hypothetical protein
MRPVRRPISEGMDPVLEFVDNPKGKEGINYHENGKMDMYMFCGPNVATRRKENTRTYDIGID